MTIPGPERRPPASFGLRATGYDACSTASNHSLDQGAQGITGTLRVLDAAGLRHAGIARNPREAQPTLLTVRGVRVAVLSYAHGFNGRHLPPGQPWRANPINPARVIADARAARKAGSRFTVVFLHWRQEYQTAPTAEQPVVQSLSHGGLSASTRAALAASLWRTEAAVGPQARPVGG